MISEKKKRILIFLFVLILMILEDIKSIKAGYFQRAHYWFSLTLFLLLLAGLVIANQCYRSKMQLLWLDRFLLLLFIICLGGFYLCSEKDKRYMISEQNKLKEMISDQKNEITGLNDIITGYIEAEKTDPPKDIRIPISSNACYGMDAQELGGQFLLQGFRNIKMLPNEHSSNIRWEEGDVTGISIDGKWLFTKGEIFSSDSEIRITYHGISD